MKKLAVLLVIVLSLTGCSRQTDFKRYTEMTHLFNSFNNYKIEENNNGHLSSYDYADGIVHFTDDESDIYCYIEDEIVYALIYDNESNVYIKQEADYDEHYFQPYEILERLNKLGGYVNMGELVWKNHEFYGNDFSGLYIYKNELHKVLELKIEVKDNYPVYLYEKYESDGKECVDEIKVSKQGVNKIDLPLNIIDYTYLEDLKEIKELK